MADSDVSLDISLVSQFGTNIILNSAGLLTTAILYGVYVVLFGCTVPILCRREGNGRAKTILLIAVVVMFAIATFFVATYMAIFVGGTQMILVQDVGRPIAEKVPGYQAKWAWLTLVEGSLFFLEVIIGDFVVVWRAWALWSDNRKVLIFPALLLLGSAGSAFAFLGCVKKHDWPIELPPTCSALNISTYVLSMATNITATGAIGYKVWLHWRAVKKYLNTLRARNGVEKVLVLLLESGVVYSILWLVQVITFIPTVGLTPVGTYIQQVLYAASVQLVGIYPTSVIILVYLQRSLWDSTGTSTYTARTVVEPHRGATSRADAPVLSEVIVLKPNRLILEDGQSLGSSSQV